MPSHATAVVVAPTEALLAWTRYGQGASASFPDACVRMCCQLRSSAEWEERNVDAFNAKELGHFYLAANEEWTHDDVATRKVKRTEEVLVAQSDIGQPKSRADPNVLWQQEDVDKSMKLDFELCWHETAVLTGTTAIRGCASLSRSNV